MKFKNKIVIIILPALVFFYSNLLAQDRQVYFSPREKVTDKYFLPGYAQVNKEKKILCLKFVNGKEIEEQEVGSLANVTVDLINRAKRSIDIAIYSLTPSPSLPEFKALIDADRRGVAIRLFLDASQSYTRGKVANLLKVIKEGGYKMKVGVLKGIYKNHMMHEKFGIFDERHVFNGSANLNQPATWTYSENRFVFKDDPEMVKAFKKEFTKLWDELGEEAALTIPIESGDKDKGNNQGEQGKNDE